MSNEQFYDETIAPALAELAKQCEGRGMPFLAMVGYDESGSVGRTVTMPLGTPAVIRYANGLARSWCDTGAVNIDAFMFAVIREARRVGHSSMILLQLGVPTKPDASSLSSRSQATDHGR